MTLCELAADRAHAPNAVRYSMGIGGKTSGTTPPHKPGMNTFTATLPNGETATKKSARPVTHAVVVHHESREAICADGQTRHFPEHWSVFRWSAAPETAIKELQRKGWTSDKIRAIPVSA